MQSRAVRLILLLLFFVALLTTSFLFWKGNAEARAAAIASRTFDDAVRSIERQLLNLRTDQLAYASANQPADRWIAKVRDELESVRAGLHSLRSETTIPDAQAGIDRATGSLGAFEKSNGRAAAYAGKGDRGLASDVVFGEGLEQTGAALEALREAGAAELQARESVVAVFRDRQVYALAAGAAASVLVVLLLVPGARTTASPAPAGAGDASEPAASAQRTRGSELDSGNVSLARHAEPVEPALASLAVSEAPSIQPAAGSAVMEAAPAPAEPVVPAGLPSTDFRGVASLCVDLARVVDTRALPSLLDRTAEILDASGIILWIADPDGRELNPIFAQGYPQQLVNRLGTIARDAENATAAAFRTSLLQTVRADDISGGAIAAPLVTAGGCVGVMAAEVRHDSERQEATLAAATIVAAQLATLVGPPSTRQQARNAGA